MSSFRSFFVFCESEGTGADLVGVESLSVELREWFLRLRVMSLSVMRWKGRMVGEGEGGGQ